MEEPGGGCDIHPWAHPRSGLLPGSWTILTENPARLNPWGGWPMKKSKFTEQQIAVALQHAEGGTSVAEVAVRWTSRRRRSIAGSSSTAA